MPDRIGSRQGVRRGEPAYGHAFALLRSRGRIEIMLPPDRPLPTPPARGAMERTDTGLQVAAPPQPRWAKIIDHTRCIGCHACTTACKSENQVPLSVTRTYVKYVDVGFYPEVRRAFQVTRCNQCEDAPCVAACPTGAMFRRPDGIV